MSSTAPESSPVPAAASPSSPRRRGLALLVASATLGVLATATVPAAANAVRPAGAVTAVAPRTASWTLVAADEFSGWNGNAVNPSVWQSLEGGSGWGNGELQAYTTRTSNASLDGKGNLRIVARKETYRGRDGFTNAYTSARLVARQAVTYGRIEARMMVPTGTGLWPAFWTVGQDIYSKGWPACGEIDIMESVNDMHFAAGAVHGLQDGSSAYKLSGSAKPAGGIGNGWHTFAITWFADEITWELDGTPYLTVRKSDLPAGATWAFSKPHLIQLDLAVGGAWPGSPAPGTAFPATMLVDYVRVYRAS